MSDNEEQDIQQPTTIEEHLSCDIIKTPTLNKNGKPRKQLSPEHLAKLAKARAIANDMKKQNQISRLVEKADRIKKETKYLNKSKEPELTPIEESKPPEPTPPEPTPPEPTPLEPEEPEEPEEIIKPKPKPKPKKTKVVIEQSSSDSDEFEPNDNVLFVKRISRKKKEPVKETQQQQIIEEPVKPKMLTPQQMMLRDSYNHMFNGDFLNNNRGMNRKFY